ncbi:hypothetical protein OPT61_g10392 [Boeremia exigua]|uniref:Uncharacterized protein n=1 Tax=Boeremia exigua TaxID=749465 RepID=A0ACC2HQ63_9PLEO|nr:hypothetical protein OPT61_g10392 [Boeremia exigua]
MQTNPTHAPVPTIPSKQSLRVTAMPAAGDDLREYLVVPLNPSASSSHPLSSRGFSASLNPELRPDTPRFHKSAGHRARSGNMEINYQPQPAPLASAHAADTPMEGIMSLDDFLTTTQAAHDAHMAARGAVQAPPAKKAKTSKNPAQPQPVAVGARSSKYTILLHEKYQALAIPQPMFTFNGNSVTRWAVEVSFPGLDNAEELQGVKADGRFNSKQEAKEAASKTALAILERLVEEGRIVRAGKAKKPKGEPTQQQPKEKEEPGENYVGQLLARNISPSANLHRLPARPPLGLFDGD